VGFGGQLSGGTRVGLVGRRIQRGLQWPLVNIWGPGAVGVAILWLILFHSHDELSMFRHDASMAVVGIIVVGWIVLAVPVALVAARLLRSAGDQYAPREPVTAPRVLARIDRS
jgi:hypothetical protein